MLYLHWKLQILSAHFHNSLYINLLPCCILLRNAQEWEWAQVRAVQDTLLVPGLNISKSCSKKSSETDDRQYYTQRPQLCVLCFNLWNGAPIHDPGRERYYKLPEWDTTQGICLVWGFFPPCSLISGIHWILSFVRNHSYSLDTITNPSSHLLSNTTHIPKACGCMGTAVQESNKCFVSTKLNYFWKLPVLYN